MGDPEENSIVDPEEGPVVVLHLSSSVKFSPLISLVTSDKEEQEAQQPETMQRARRNAGAPGSISSALISSNPRI